MGENETISGWLIVFRDLTEEIRLSQLREDLTHMLVHDLFSTVCVTGPECLNQIQVLFHSGGEKVQVR